EHEVGLADSVVHRARIVAAMAGVDDDARDAKSQLPRQRKPAATVHGRRNWRNAVVNGRCIACLCLLTRNLRALRVLRGYNGLRVLDWIQLAREVNHDAKR